MPMLGIEIFITLHYFVNTVTSLYRIVGGNEVNIEDVPYQLSLRRQDAHICGAVLISPKYALSAAHCFTRTDLYTVKAGSDEKDEGGIVTAIKNVMLHPERANHRYDYDIAILEFVETLPITNKIKPINLPENNQILKSGVAGIVSGFGDVFESENTGSEHLRAAEVFVKDKNWCMIYYVMYGINLSDLVFCAGVPGGGKDSCQGDSGGPFVIDDVLYGLVSYGVSCGNPLYPGVYTSVAEFREFIRINSGV